jgi:hypothetical protein
MDWAYGYAHGKLAAWSPKLPYDVAEDIIGNVWPRLLQSRFYRKFQQELDTLYRTGTLIITDARGENSIPPTSVARR